MATVLGFFLKQFSDQVLRKCQLKTVDLKLKIWAKKIPHSLEINIKINFFIIFHNFKSFSILA